MYNRRRHDARIANLLFMPSRMRAFAMPFRRARFAEIFFKRLGVAMGAYVLVTLLVPLSSNALEGVGRYSAVLFPAFMLVGSFKSPRLHEAIVIAASLFLALFVCLFITLHPIY